MHGTRMHDAHAKVHLVWVASAHGGEVGDGGSERRNAATPVVVVPQPLPLIAAMIERPVRIGKQPFSTWSQVEEGRPSSSLALPTHLPMPRRVGNGRGRWSSTSRWKSSRNYGTTAI